MMIKDLIDLKTIKSRNARRTETTKKVAVGALAVILIGSAGLITGILVSAKVREKYELIKKDVIHLGKDVKEDVVDGFKEVKKDISKTTNDISDDLNNKKR